MTIEELIKLKESDDKIEFKEAKKNFSFAGSEHREQKDRRKCFLGYIVALANEKGGWLVLGINDNYPHQVVGTDFAEGGIGDLVDEVYNRLGIRVNISEEFEKEDRILIVKVPSRPVGKTLKFEGVPLMRTGDSLRNMNDEEIYSILSEQEPDFSKKICDGLAYDDLDEGAIELMKMAYAKKQNNNQFLTMPNKQILIDLDLMVDNKFNYAALILLGKEKIIRNYLPQSEVRLEYRKDSGQITFDNRIIYCKPYFILIDELWKTINLRNGKFPIQEGAYIFDIPFFNEEVIREAINNAISHRDYKIQSEVLIKQSTHELSVISPGGFPIGVTIDNILTINSTPRNRLLADVLEKTGAVERSGQGVDKMFYQCLSEAKEAPDYSKSDDFQVNLKISAVVKDKAFALFIKDFQQHKKDDEKLSVHEIITLDKIRIGIDKKKLDKDIVNTLLEKELIKKFGKTRNIKYILSPSYYSFIGKEVQFTKLIPIDEMQIIIKILKHLNEFKEAKMGDFINLFEGELSKDKVKRMIYGFTKDGFLDSKGKFRGTRYTIGKKTEENAKFISRAVSLGIEKMKENGEISKE